MCTAPCTAASAGARNHQHGRARAVPLDRRSAARGAGGALPFHCVGCVGMAGAVKDGLLLGWMWAHLSLSRGSTLLLCCCCCAPRPRTRMRACTRHQATEDFMVHLFEDCNLCAIHAKRVTISECSLTQRVRLQLRPPGLHHRPARTACSMLAPTPATLLHARTRSAEGPAAGAPHPRPCVRRVQLVSCVKIRAQPEAQRLSWAPQTTRDRPTRAHFRAHIIGVQGGDSPRGVGCATPQVGTRCSREGGGGTPPAAKAWRALGTATHTRI